MQQGTSTSLFPPQMHPLVWSITPLHLPLSVPTCMHSSPALQGRWRGYEVTLGTRNGGLMRKRSGMPLRGGSGGRRVRWLGGNMLVPVMGYGRGREGMLEWMFDDFPVGHTRCLWWLFAVLIQSICCTLWPVTNMIKFWLCHIAGEGVSTRKVSYPNSTKGGGDAMSPIFLPLPRGALVLVGEGRV